MSGPFIIPPDNIKDFDANEYRYAHRYPTRRKAHMANLLTTINAQTCKQMFNAARIYHDEHMANAIVNEETG
eukprot:8071907-Ditylum_brightwellii.AAC.1